MRLLPVLTISLSAIAWTPRSLDAQSTDVRTMLATLQDLKQKQADSSKTQLSQAITDFSAAATDENSALDFYAEAVRVTKFVGQQRAETAFHDWRKNELGKVNGDAVRAVLRYTTLSLQRSAGATDEQIFPSLLAYAQDTASIAPSLDDQPILRQPVSDNIFAQWYNISSRLAGLDKWEPVPGNIDGIYEKLLLPVMRENRDPRILQYWDDKIFAEKEKASAATAAFSTDRFNQVRRPILLWSRAEDEVAIGMRDQGINDMYNLVKAFPTHQDAGKWIPELQSLLTAPAATGAPAASGTPIPGT
jgi:hypothetical protein